MDAAIPDVHHLVAVLREEGGTISRRTRRRTGTP